MQQAQFEVCYPDSEYCPERFLQTFDYKNNVLAVSQQDVDFLIRKDDKIIFIESKSSGGEVPDSQRITMETIASDKNKAYVVCRHYDEITKGTIPMLHKAWDNQIVEAFWYIGEWYSCIGESLTLKDFVNEFFKDKWGYSEPVVI